MFVSNPAYQTVFWAAYLIWFLPKIVGLMIQRSRRGAESHDRGSMFVLLGSLWIGVFFAFFIAFGMRAAAITWHPRAWFFLGIILMVAGVAFRWYAIRVLGSSFTRNVAIHQGQTVMDTGPYRLIRHPAYTGTLITMFGLGLALGNWLSLLVLLAGWAAGHLYRVSVEEKVLVNYFGEPYRDYIRRTRRFIPFVY